MRGLVASVGPLAAGNASLLRSAASLVTGAVALTITSLDKPRRILFTSSGNDTSLIYTVSGFNVSGNPISETVTGVSAAAVATVLDYGSGIVITSNGASGGTVSIGTNGVAGSNWVRLDEWAPPATGIQCDANGTVNYTVQDTIDDPNDPTNPVAPASMTWFNTTDASGVTATASIQTNFAYAPRYVRLVLNSGTGSVTATVLQYSSPPR